MQNSRNNSSPSSRSLRFTVSRTAFLCGCAAAVPRSPAPGREPNHRRPRLPRFGRQCATQWSWPRLERRPSGRDRSWPPQLSSKNPKGLDLSHLCNPPTCLPQKMLVEKPSNLEEPVTCGQNDVVCRSEPWYTDVHCWFFSNRKANRCSIGDN